MWQACVSLVVEFANPDQLRSDSHSFHLKHMFGIKASVPIFPSITIVITTKSAVENEHKSAATTELCSVLSYLRALGHNIPDKDELIHNAQGTPQGL